MSFENCINSNEKLSETDKKEIIKMYGEFKKPFITKYGSAQGELLAIDKFTKDRALEIAKAREAKALTVSAWVNIYEELKAKDAEYTKLKDTGYLSKVAFAGSGKVHAVGKYLEDSVFHKSQGIQRTALTAIGEAVEKFRPKSAGLKQDVAGYREVAKSIVKMDFKGEYGKYGKAIHDVLKTLRDRYERAGGIIGDIDNYMPQRFVLENVKKYQPKEFVADLKQKLDFVKMGWVDETGSPTVDIDAILNKTYKKIITGNLEEISQILDEGGIPSQGVAAIRKRHQNQRIFHYKSADDYLEINKKYGVGDEGLFDITIGHIDAMARDIAILESIGANADSNVRRMLAFIRLDNPTISQMKRLESMWKVMAGRTSFEGEVSAMYKFYEGLSAWQRTTKLGNAAISALADVGSVANTAKLNGLPVSKFLENYVNYLNPASVEDRQFARLNMRIAQAAQGMSFRNTRFVDDAARGGKLQWMAQFVHQAGFLAHLTDAAQTSVVASTSGFFAQAKRANLRYDELDANMLDAFARFKITEQDYNNILKADPLLDADEVEFLRPEDVFKVDAKSAEKYNTWMSAMMNASTNEASLFTRAISTGGERRGTTERMLRGTLMMFKSFGFSMAYNHLLPMVRNVAVGKQGSYAHLGAFIGASFVTGAFVQQLQQIASGKTPRNMDEGRFWVASLATSGGLGIFGNFLFADYTNVGNTFQSTLLGANAGWIESFLGLTLGNIAKAADPNREVKIGDDMAMFMRSNVPTLWWNRLLIERIVLDNIERMANPDYDNRMRRVENRLKKNYNQEFFWEPPK